MGRKKTKGISSGDKRAEMRTLERELRRSGFRVAFWRTYGKRILLSVVVLAILAGVGWGGKWLWDAYVSRYDVFAIEQLEYHSNGILDEKQALALMGYESGNNMLSLEPEELEQRLYACSAVRKASVKRMLPSTLLVELDVRIPVAWLHCPGAGVRSYDTVNGMFIDRDTVAFHSMPDVFEAYKDVPVLQIPTPVEGEIRAGHEIDNLETAVKLVTLLKKERRDDFAKARIVKVRNEWSFLVEFDDGCQAIFGIYDTERQVDGFYTRVAHARSQGRRIKSINMLPDRNVPVVYDESYDEIPVAEPVE